MKMSVDYWGRGGKRYVAPHSKIIGGGGGGAAPLSTRMVHNGLR